MSDVTLSPGLDEPELFAPSRPQRRFARRPAQLVPALRRPAAELAEGDSSAVNVREGLYRRTLAAADALAAFGALALVVVLHAGAQLQGWVLLAMPIAVLVSKVGGLYERDELVLKKTTLDEAPALLQITGLFALIVFLGQNVFVHAGMTPPLVAELWLASFFAVFLGRVAARKVASLIARPERCLIVGDAEAVRTVRGKLETGGVNAKVVASVRLDSVNPRVSLERFRSIVCDNDVHRVILAPVTTDARDTLELVRVAKSVGVRVSLLPRLFEVVGSSVEFDHLDGLTMLGVRRFGLTRSSMALKRMFDVAGSTLMLLAVAPIMAAVALAVRLDSRGPILFRQTRIGRDGKPFEIFKFRTMVPDAEERKDELAHLNETEGLFKIADDPRITRDRRVAAPHGARRAAAAAQRGARRDEPRRPAPARRRRGREDRGPGPQPAAPHPGHDRPLADPRLRAHPAARDGRHRLPLRRELVALDRSEDPAADRAVHARSPRHVTHVPA